MTFELIQANIQKYTFGIKSTSYLCIRSGKTLIIYKQDVDKQHFYGALFYTACHRIVLID